MQTVLVTGAAGTVGNYAVSLAEAAGYRVIATDLSAKGVAVPVRGEVRAGDLRDRAFVERLVRGVDHVIHTAAQLDVGTPYETLRAVNTDAVATLYDLASAAGAKRFLHVSTALIYAEGQRGPIPETGAIAPRGPHGRSKLEAERLLEERRGKGASWTIVRAAPIYGRRGRHLAAILLTIGPALRLVTPLLPRPAGGPIHNLVHAEDVARALLHLLPRADAEHRVYNVADDDPLTLGDRVAETYRSYGLHMVPAGELPRSALDRIARAFQARGAHQSVDRALLAAWRLVVLRHGLKSALRSRVDREALTLLYDDLQIDTHALRETGFTPRYPRFVEGFRQVLRWYQAERWVPRYA